MQCESSCKFREGSVALVNWQTKARGELKHLLYHFHDSNRTNEACTLLHSNTWHQREERNSSLACAHQARDTPRSRVWGLGGMGEQQARLATGEMGWDG